LLSQAEDVLADAVWEEWERIFPRLAPLWREQWQQGELEAQAGDIAFYADDVYIELYRLEEPDAEHLWEADTLATCDGVAHSRRRKLRIGQEEEDLLALLARIVADRDTESLPMPAVGTAR
jgi:hypothetical protein